MTIANFLDSLNASRGKSRRLGNVIYEILRFFRNLKDFLYLKDFLDVQGL